MAAAVVGVAAAVPAAVVVEEAVVVFPVAVVAAVPGHRRRALRPHARTARRRAHPPAVRSRTTSQDPRRGPPAGPMSPAPRADRPDLPKEAEESPPAARPPVAETVHPWAEEPRNFLPAAVLRLATGRPAPVAVRRTGRVVVRRIVPEAGIALEPAAVLARGMSITSSELAEMIAPVARRAPAVMAVVPARERVPAAMEVAPARTTV